MTLVRHHGLPHSTRCTTAALVICTLLSACVSTAGPAAPPAVAPTISNTPDPLAPSQPSPQAVDAPLPADATYADLIGLAAERSRTSTQQGDSAEQGNYGHCLLARDTSGYRLGVAAAAATSTWPDPAEPAAANSAVRVLTPWGTVGEAVSGPLWVSFTPISPTATRRVAVLASIDDRGVTLGHPASLETHSAQAPAPIRAEPMSTSLAAVEVMRMQGQKEAVLFVASTRGLPLAVLYDFLHALPEGLPIALTFALPEGTQMPTPAEPPISAHCPDGLPDPGADEVEGELSQADLQASLQSLGGRARQCFASARGPAGAGGRVTLGLRIGPTGGVQNACLVNDELGDPIMAACISESAKQLRFSTPKPAGFVDVHLPLKFSASEQPAPRATCP